MTTDDLSDAEKIAAWDRLTELVEASKRMLAGDSTDGREAPAEPVHDGGAGAFGADSIGG